MLISSGRKLHDTGTRKGEDARLIEEKLSHLTSEQRREVEDFIDFMMSHDRNPEPQGLSGGSSFSEIREFSDFRKDTLFGGSHETSGSTGDDILSDYPEYGDTGNVRATNESNPVRPVNQGAKRVPGKPERRDPSQLLDWLD
jgi:hypothetical protein